MTGNGGQTAYENGNGLGVAHYCFNTSPNTFLQWWIGWIELTTCKHQKTIRKIASTSLVGVTTCGW